MFFDTSIIAENDLEYLVSLYTHSLPITTGSGQTNTTILQFKVTILFNVKYLKNGTK